MKSLITRWTGEQLILAADGYINLDLKDSIRIKIKLNNSSLSGQIRVNDYELAQGQEFDTDNVVPISVNRGNVSIKNVDTVNAASISVSYCSAVSTH